MAWHDDISLLSPLALLSLCSPSSLSEEKLKELISYVDPDNTRDYSIVGIMGCQSSGKSTLLNQLFRTKFQMMDASIGRQQTTRGIWLDAAHTTHNLVIMDLEGTDSAERGEDRTTFERQTILYAVALCEILIVNLWEHDIGRYTASNFNILKTVFEVNLQLFKENRNKTMLLFIIRDHIESYSPLKRLEEKLTKDMHGIWSEISKPSGLEDSTLEDFFDCRFVGLSNYITQRDVFLQEVGDLRDRFADSTHPQYLLNTEYHGQKSVPADGFAHYAHSIWNTIVSNKDLNLPSQREMLAVFRCDELSAQAKEMFAAEIASIKAKADAGFVPDCGAQLQVPANAALALYDEGASKYVSSIAVAKRADLIGKLRETIIDIIQGQMAHVVKQATKSFTSSLRAKLSSDKPTIGFFDIVAKVRKESLEKFAATTNALLNGLEIFEISTQAQFDEFERHMEAAVQAARTEQLILLADAASEQSRQLCANDVADLLQRADDDMWVALGKVFATTFDKVRDSFEQHLQDLQARPNEVRSIERRLASKLESFFQEGAQQEARGMLNKMISCFVDLFQKDPATGMPRRWTPEIDVDGLFVKARGEALRFLPLFKTMRLRENWGGRCQEIMTARLMPSPPASPSNAGGHSRAHSTAVENKDVADLVDVQVIMDEPEEDSEEYVPEPDFATAMKRRTSVFAPTVTATDLITREQLAQLESDFNREITMYLMQARNDQEIARRNAGLPMWVYAALVILGYNEFVAIIKSPFVMYPAILMGIGCLILIQMGLWDVTVAAVKVTWNQFKKSLETQEPSSTMPPYPPGTKPLPGSVARRASNPAVAAHVITPNVEPEIELPAPATAPAQSKDD